jgi:hypothetical protein
LILFITQARDSPDLADQKLEICKKSLRVYEEEQWVKCCDQKEAINGAYSVLGIATPFHKITKGQKDFPVLISN